MIHVYFSPTKKMNWIVNILQVKFLVLVLFSDLPYFFLALFPGLYYLFYALVGLFLIYGELILKPIYSQLSWGKIFTIFFWI